MLDVSLPARRGVGATASERGAEVRSPPTVPFGAAARDAA
jgi:hypothetical protein